MPDYTITIETSDELVIGAYYNSVQEGLEAVIFRYIDALGNALIDESDSQLNGRKLNRGQFRAEIARLNAQGKLPDHKEG